MLKVLLACALLLPALTLMLHQQGPEKPWLSKDKSKWSGYLPQCDKQCLAAQGEICHESPKVCCRPNACTDFFGFTTCS